MIRCLIAGLVLAMAGSEAVAKPLRPTDISPLCAVDIDRFCPYLTGTTEWRNQRICLKPYQNSLAPGCRRAMKAAP